MTTAADLGPVLSRHPYDRGMGYFALVLEAMCALIGVAFFAIIVFDDSATAGWSDILAGLSCSAFFFLIGAGLFWMTMRGMLRNMELVLHEGGVVVNQRSGSEAHTWRALTSVRIERVNRRGTIYETIKLSNRDGVDIEISKTEFEGVGPETVQIVTEKSFEALFPWYRKELEEGRDIRFGDFKLNTESFTDAVGTTPWTEVKSWEVSGVALWLQLHDGTTRSVIVHGVTNAHILLHIVAGLVPDPA